MALPSGVDIPSAVATFLGELLTSAGSVSASAASGSLAEDLAATARRLHGTGSF